MEKGMTFGVLAMIIVCVPFSNVPDVTHEIQEYLFSIYFSFILMPMAYNQALDRFCMAHFILFIEMSIWFLLFFTSYFILLFFHFDSFFFFNLFWYWTHSAYIIDIPLRHNSQIENETWDSVKADIPQEYNVCFFHEVNKATTRLKNYFAFHLEQEYDVTKYATIQNKKRKIKVNFISIFFYFFFFFWMKKQEFLFFFALLCVYNYYSKHATVKIGLRSASIFVFLAFVFLYILIFQYLFFLTLLTFFYCLQSSHLLLLFLFLYFYIILLCLARIPIGPIDHRTWNQYRQPKRYWIICSSETNRIESMRVARFF